MILISSRKTLETFFYLLVETRIVLSLTTIGRVSRGSEAQNRSSVPAFLCTHCTPELSAVPRWTESTPTTVAAYQTPTVYSTRTRGQVRACVCLAWWWSGHCLTGACSSTSTLAWGCNLMDGWRVAVAAASSKILQIFSDSPSWIFRHMHEVLNINCV
jgi:hypothetical protein